MSETFYLKLTELEASTMIEAGLNALKKGRDDGYERYTNHVVDESTGDIYWCIQNYWDYDVIGWLNNNYPDLPRYTHEFVMQFIPTGDGQ